jgi:cation diffusion facilitator family transporter
MNGSAIEEQAASRHDLDQWRHAHAYGTEAARHAERRTRWVVALTFATMLVELLAGVLTGSMALLADAWHMASHVGAMALAAFAYWFSRRYADDARFTFGTGKVSALAGYSSALLLGVVAFWMVWESVQRLFDPVAIHYAEAMAVAALGLAVNLASAWLLQDAPHEEHAHLDHNLRAAYLHVLADALTSVLAIVALAGGMFFGWRFLDPLMGLIGAAVVGRWAWGLARDGAKTLLDAEDHAPATTEIRRIIGSLPDHEIADLHVWRVGPASRACILSLVTHSLLPTEHYRQLLVGVAGIDHLTLEVNQCRDARCLAHVRVTEVRCPASDVSTDT